MMNFSPAEARALESARRLFVETRDLRIRAEKAEAEAAEVERELQHRAEKAERKHAELVAAVRGLADQWDADCADGGSCYWHARLIDLIGDNQ